MNVTDTSRLALLIHVQPPEAQSIRQGLEPTEGTSIRWQSINDVDTALARLAGGGVDMACAPGCHSTEKPFGR